MLRWKSGGNQPVILRSPTCRPSLPICESSLSPSPSPSPSSSSSFSSSPGGRRQDGRGALSGRDDDLPRRPPQLTRQRKLRHLSDFDVEGLGRGLDGGVTNGCGGSGGWCAAAAPTSSALIPQPLPLPAGDSAHKGSANSGHEFLNLPSFRGERVEAILSAEPSPSIMEPAGERLPSAASFKRLVSHSLPSGVDSADRRRQHQQSQLKNERSDLRLSVPSTSPPSSGFSSPMGSPRRYKPGDFFPSNHLPPPHAPAAWSAPELPPAAVAAGYSIQTSPEKVPSNGGGSVNVHPLPLPPGAVAAARNDSPFMAGCWQKGKLIGSGTFGNVYVATNRHTGALCAMKEVNVIPDDPKSAECIRQLEQEVKLLSQLKHRNIVQYYGSEIIDDRFYIYLEYVYPGSINKYVREHCGAITESIVRNFTLHILRGLAYLHSKKTIHRDIKGANLLVDASGVVKLADFGMAKHLSGTGTVNSLKGSPHWMAPEVVQGTMNKEMGYDLSVDIWSLGCTIIEMFTGRHPWDGFEGPQAMFQVLLKSPEIPEALSPEGRDFLQCCFRRNPSDRPTASQLLDHPFIRGSHDPAAHPFSCLRQPEVTAHSARDGRPKADPPAKGKLQNGFSLRTPFSNNI